MSARLADLVVSIAINQFLTQIAQNNEYDASADYQAFNQNPVLPAHGNDNKGSDLEFKHLFA